MIDPSLTPEQLQRAELIAESRGIDLETAQELVWLRDRLTQAEAKVMQEPQSN